MPVQVKNKPRRETEEKPLIESVELDKKVFHHILNNDLILKFEPYIFNKSYKVIRDIYKVIYEYYKQYNKLPSSTIINELDFSISEKVADELFKQKSSYLSYYNENPERFENYFNDFVSLRIASNEVLNDIDYLKANNVEHAKEYLQNKGIEIFEKEEKEEDEPLNNTDLISDEVYNNLPDFLKNSCSHFKGRERDVYLTSELVVLSSLFKNVKGLYDRKPVYTNLYAFIAAPTANGKGVIGYAKNTLDKFNEREKQENQRLKQSYSEEELKKKNIVDKRLLIPGNASTASYIDELKNNSGVGLTIETEADTITNNKKQDWGDYDTCLRIGFHHENISLVRKNGRIEIETPKISFVTSGTMKQLLNFIPSTENGLYSRFIYYTYQQKPVFRNPWDTDEDYELIFKNYGAELLEMFDFYERYNNTNEPITYTFNFTEKQKEKFNKSFPFDLNETIAFSSGNDIMASFYRLGLITYKIAMILSILRNYDKRKNNIFESVPNQIICEDIDFEISLKLFEVYLKHMKLIYDNMGSKEEVKFKRNYKEQMYNELPDSFTRRQLKDLGTKYENLSEGSVDKIIKSWKEAGKIKREEGKQNFIKT